MHRAERSPRFWNGIKNRRFAVAEKDLAAAVDGNHVERVRWTARVAGVESHDDGDIFWTYRTAELWPGNQIVGAQFPAPTAPTRVAELLRYHLDRRAACNWVTGPATVPANLGTVLRGQGFSCRIHCQAMAASLSSLPENPEPIVDIDFQKSNIPVPLHPVTTHRRQAQFDGLIAVGKLRPHRVWYFAAIDSSIPVGTATLFEGSNVAGIYDVEVIPSHRGRGIATQLVRDAMQLAKRHGYETAVLSSTALGSGVYSALGFKKVGVLSSWRYGRMRQIST